MPDAKAGQNYKYEVKVKGGLTYLKADPYAFGQQLRPDTASVIREDAGSKVKWEDKEWMQGRKERQGSDKPISIYELYLGSFRQGEEGGYMNYRELAPLLPGM